MSSASATPMSEHRVVEKENGSRRLVCLRCSGEADSFDQYADKPCRSEW